MENKLLSEIVDNYKEQFELYKQMLNLSVQQVKLLQDNIEDINDLHSILTARQVLMDDIINLNKENKSLQNQLISKLGIKEFVINKLEGLVEEQILKDLEKIITDISTLLSKINENDKRNEALIKQGFKKKPDDFKTTSAAKATKAYKKAMQKE
ncbi:MAG: hypothetical protein GX790_03025 [Syntrophomonadaceae bacterium]|nr:hypothetical protein [Syntrophomonadaceae bacterium]